MNQSSRQRSRRQTGENRDPLYHFIIGSFLAASGGPHENRNRTKNETLARPALDTWIRSSKRGGSTGTRDGRVKFYVTAARGFKAIFKKFAEESRSSLTSRANSRAPQPAAKQQAREAEAAGHLPEAREHFYIAACFYTNAMWAVYEDRNPRRISWQEKKRACYDKFIRYAGRPIERVELPCQGKLIHALLHLPSGIKAGEEVPCVMYIPGMDGVKEDNPATGDPFLERGIAVFAIDGPGQGETREGGLTCTASNYADAGKLACDYLVKRPEIDSGRLAILASSMGSYWAPRVVAEEKRFKACAVSGVCMEPGQYAIFNMSSPTFKLNYMYMSGYDDEAAFDEFAKSLTLKGVTAKITCPYMVVAGEDDEHCDMKFVYELMGEIPAPKLLVRIPRRATLDPQSAFAITV